MHTGRKKEKKDVLIVFLGRFFYVANVANVKNMSLGCSLLSAKITRGNVLTTNSS